MLLFELSHPIRIRFISAALTCDPINLQKLLHLTEEYWRYILLLDVIALLLYFIAAPAIHFSVKVDGPSGL